MISEGEPMKNGQKSESREAQEDSEHSWQHPKEWKGASQLPGSLTQNHRMAEVARDLWRSSGPTPLLKPPKVSCP